LLILFEHKLIEARDKKIKEITLEATLTAHEFYKKMGFSDSGPQTSVEMRRVTIAFCIRKHQASYFGTDQNLWPGVV
jgi:N-acetylglutamate synthase-like GNAT family acetyltransferase